MKEFARLLRDYVELNEQRFEDFEHVCKLDLRILETRAHDRKALEDLEAARLIRRARLDRTKDDIARVRGMIVAMTAGMNPTAETPRTTSSNRTTTRRRPVPGQSKLFQ